jgi:hypothetical protein
MTKLLYSQSTATIKPYPRNDNNPILGLDPDYLVLDKIESPQPEYDPATQTIRAEWVIDIGSLEYHQEWIIEPILVAPVEDWPNFSLYLFGHPAFVAYGVTANSVNPWMLPAVVERYGRVLPEGLADSNFPFYWNIFCQALSVTTEHMNEWADVAETFNLRPDFVAVLRG